MIKHYASHVHWPTFAMIFAPLVVLAVFAGAWSLMLLFGIAVPVVVMAKGHIMYCTAKDKSSENNDKKE